MARTGVVTTVRSAATTMASGARVANTTLTPPATPHTSAWTDLSALEQRIKDTHDLLTQLEQTLSSVSTPMPPTGDSIQPSDAPPPAAPLTQHARLLYGQVDLLAIRLVQLTQRIEL